MIDAKAEALLAWIGFFRQIGVNGLSIDGSPRRAAAKAAQVPRAPVAEPRPAAVRAPTPPVSETLDAVRADLGDCRRCKLAAGRHTIVFGKGAPNAEIVFVGEGPGENEDLQGEPFVGKAGGLLTRMIAAMGFTRDEVYIANVVKCRPPGNRDPEPDEILACRPFLERQLRAIRPKVIVALGAFASQLLTQSTEKISKLRGSFQEFDGIKVMPTFHPSYLLQSPSKKKEAWLDLQQVMKLLGKPIPESTGVRDHGIGDRG